MESEDFIALPDCGDSGFEDGDESKGVDAQHTSSEGKEEDKLDGENLGLESSAQGEESECVPEEEKVDGENLGPESSAQGEESECVPEEEKVDGENLGPESSAQAVESECVPEASLTTELVDNDSDMEIEDINNLPALTNSGPIEGGVQNVNNDLQPTLYANCHLAVQDVSSVEIYSTDVIHVLHNSTSSAKQGVKRARTTVDEPQASVHVTYSHLTRASKYKLEELLQQWSHWHAKHVSLSQDTPQVLESGEETLFPALHVGTDKMAGVSFWMDSQSGTAQNMESLSLDSPYTPLYDRGYALGLTVDGSSTNQEGGLEIIDDASRCFNCGSYNHALRECPKHRDHVAVNKARKELKIKRNQTPNSRNSTRYYQDSPAGRYDGLRPGALDAETRKLLGLGELDPPPWLNRMREIGYPPGYLDVYDEDQPSGIIIYGLEETKVDQEDGEIIGADLPEPSEPQTERRKMTVDFLGVNAPIPENADERRWLPGPSFSNSSRNHSHNRANHYSEPVRGHHREQKRSRDYRDDGPPGVDLGHAPSSYPPRYGSSEYSSRGATYGRSNSDRSRSGEFSYPHSPTRDSDLRFDYLTNESKHAYDPDGSSNSWERAADRHRQHRRR